MRVLLAQGVQGRQLFFGKLLALLAFAGLILLPGASALSVLIATRSWRTVANATARMACWSILPLILPAAAAWWWRALFLSIRGN